MESSILDEVINSYPDFPKTGILFRDMLPILEKPEVFSKLIKSMSAQKIIKEADAIVAIDARGFLLGTPIALEVSKPLVVARKPGKLPGELLSESYQLEYGENTLCVQAEAIKKYQKFTIIDDLLATGGTVNAVSNILLNAGKKVLGLSVVIELEALKGRKTFDFPVESQINYN